jgi:hypothetical protein
MKSWRSVSYPMRGQIRLPPGGRNGGPSTTQLR